MIKHKEIRVFGHLLLVIPTQIFEFGSGFLFAFTKRVIFNYETFTGFEKNIILINYLENVKRCLFF